MSDLFLFLCASRPLFLRIDYFILKTVIVAFLKNVNAVVTLLPLWKKSENFSVDILVC